jgi:Fe2+ or Zn2+ uptake regulation protein
VVTTPQLVDQEVHAKIAAILASAQQRYTPQRRALVETLVRLERPATIAEICASAPQLPLSTAYRNLTTLADAQIVRRVSGSDDFGRFELAEQLSGHHHHVVCESCGLVMDAAASPALEAALSETAKAIAAANGFDVTEHRLELVGRCTRCRANR